MIDGNVYSAVKWASLDQLMESRDKCLRVIRGCRDLYAPQLYRNYYSTAVKHKVLYNKEILKRRAKGERTVQELLFLATGNVFVVLKPV